MKEPLRVAIAGAGYFARFHHEAWRRMAEAGSVDVVGVCDKVRDRAEACAQGLVATAAHVDFEAMLDDTRPDLVDIVTPPPTHASFVRAAVRRGAAVICQKPFTPCLADAERLVADIGAAGGRVYVHENFRFQPWYRVLKSLLTDGVVGEPYQVSFRLRPGDGQGPDAYLERQPYFQSMPRFLVHETAIHLIDTFRFLFGEVTAVYARLDRLNPAIAGEDAGIVLFDFARGARGVFDGNRLSDHPAENRRLTMGEMCIEGAKGTLTLDGYGTIRHRRFGCNDWEVVEYEWQDTGYAGDCVYLTSRHVVEHLVTGTPVSNEAAAYLANLRIEEAVYRSAERGAKIDIDRIPAATGGTE